ncbi:30S ribosome-binding factor RbfA [Helicobacter ailurogastricus]|uniref:Ribosome-binding factor A n=1 Tax=Helicobacter ailurogastricus TaxID=1578720 RepID=A0A0K2Y4I4_9HELI|nr:30S ribosome-binding factor RbfA [Helicobacter ailurogastricus]BDQ29168.1 ribosome-binding factor A [Helicobacter ailurogastricus]CRF52055.1 Ribosome-binding factor A [Helicobacter ailurogastricus]
MENIHAKRLDAGLLEYLQEALSALDDPRLSGLTLTKVHCSKGKYHAQAYIDGVFLNAEERAESLKALKKATSLLKAHVLQVSGWFKCPNFVFMIDESLEQQQRLDALFARIRAQ